MLSETHEPAPPGANPDVPPEAPASRAASNVVLRVLTALVGGAYRTGVGLPGRVAVCPLAARLRPAGAAGIVWPLERNGVYPYRVAGALLGTLLALRALVPVALPLAVAGGAAIVLAGPFRQHRGSMLSNLAATALGLFYPVVFLTYLLDLRLGGPALADADAFALTLSLFLLVWATDTFAYVAGRGLGPASAGAGPSRRRRRGRGLSAGRWRRSAWRRC